MVVILFSQFRSFFCVIIFRIFSQVNLFAKGRRQKFDTLSLKIFKYKIEMFELRFKMVFCRRREHSRMLVIIITNMEEKAKTVFNNVILRVIFCLYIFIYLNEILYSFWFKNIKLVILIKEKRLNYSFLSFL